jgi:hypothetical protein
VEQLDLHGLAHHVMQPAHAKETPALDVAATSESAEPA